MRHRLSEAWFDLTVLAWGLRGVMVVLISHAREKMCRRRLTGWAVSWAGAALIVVAYWWHWHR